ncbi:MAG: FAD-dependent thymidylate synthase, partial [Candidatus Cloacimonetes bacterium]|nr:FAD-dependent thymidylate synthase [Candidatus Cloacimonadota bacterium]
MSLQSRIKALKDAGESEHVTAEKFAALLNLAHSKNSGCLVECLDDGFVRLVDHMGNDSAVVQAARVSYGAGTRSINDDRGLIRYLMSHRHTTPLEMTEWKFHVRVPMDCWRQWIRHRTASVNEYSTRYSE